MAKVDEAQAKVLLAHERANLRDAREERARGNRRAAEAMEAINVIKRVALTEGWNL